jgi:DNA polymerase
MPVVLVGEAPGEQESVVGKPFVGSSGKELRAMCRQAGFDSNLCYLTNVFFERPPGNKVDYFMCKKAEASKEYAHYLPKLRREHPNYPWPDKYTFAKLGQGKYVHPHWLGELDRLRQELTEWQPNLVIALGATASWALLGEGKITNMRGTVEESTLVPGLKVLPTFHPAAIMRQWQLRPVVIADLHKAKREMSFPGISRPKRQIWIEPTLQDIYDFHEQYVEPSDWLYCDVETAQGQITCFGIAPDENHALVIPFVDRKAQGNSYWQNAASELLAWQWIDYWMRGRWFKVGQNFNYDMQYIWGVHGIPVFNFADDTMLMHHAIQPEMKKGLGFMGSIYTNEASWKLMVKHSGEDSVKRDE